VNLEALALAPERREMAQSDGRLRRHCSDLEAVVRGVQGVERPLAFLERVSAVDIKDVNDKVIDREPTAMQDDDGRTSGALPILDDTEDAETVAAGNGSEVLFR
jgi:hypothetical protein